MNGCRCDVVVGYTLSSSSDMSKQKSRALQPNAASGLYPLHLVNDIPDRIALPSSEKHRRIQQRRARSCEKRSSEDEDDTEPPRRLDRASCGPGRFRWEEGQREAERRRSIQWARWWRRRTGGSRVEGRGGRRRAGRMCSRSLFPLCSHGACRRQMIPLPALLSPPSHVRSPPDSTSRNSQCEQREGTCEASGQVRRACRI